MLVHLRAISLHQKNVEPHASWVQLQVSKETVWYWLFPFSLRLSSLLLSLYHSYTFLSMNTVDILAISLHLHSNSPWPFFSVSFQTYLLWSPSSCHPYLHISHQYTFILHYEQLVSLSSSLFHNPYLSLLTSQVLTSCSFSPDCTNTDSSSTKFWEKSLSSRSQHHNGLLEKPLPGKT